VPDGQGSCSSFSCFQELRRGSRSLRKRVRENNDKVKLEIKRKIRAMVRV
jgi:hypothetical protein